MRIIGQPLRFLLYPTALSALVVFTCNFCLFAQSQPINNARDLLFTHLTDRDGLSYNTVSCVFKDSRGFIWIGTQDGLNRYDAANLKVYRHTATGNDIAGNNITQIAEDKAGNLWVGTTEGLSKINERNDKIQSYRHSTTDDSSLIDNGVKTILVDDAGSVWLGTFAGIDRYDTAHNCFIHYRNTLENDIQKQRYSNNISKLYQDKHERIWVCTYQGLFLFDKKLHSFKKFVAPVTSKNVFLDNLFADIFEDHSHCFWLATWGGGLKKFDAEKQSFDTYKWNEKPEIPSADNICLSITESKDRYGAYHLWIATPQGLGDFDNAKKAWTFYYNKITDPNTLSSRIINSVYTDNVQLLWVSTANGVNILDPYKQFFVTHRFNISGNNDSVTQFGGITSLLPDGDSIWVTTWYGNGLYLLNANLNVLNKWHTIPPASKNPESHQVEHISKQGDDFWISTFNGLVRFNKKNKTFRVILPDSVKKNNMPTVKVDRTLVDSHGLIWVFFYRNGFAWLNPETEKFTPLNQTAKMSAPHYAMYDVIEDATGNVWIGCDSFLTRYNRKENVFNRYYAPGLIPAYEILCFMNDSQGRLWVGTKGGISIINPKTLKSEFITMQNGLQSDIIYGMQQDRHGRVWIATHNGLHLYDPTTKKIAVYRKDEGLEDPNLELTFVHTTDGRLLLGGWGYITEFYPDSVSTNTVVPPVIITEVKVFGINEPMGYDERGNKQITLSYRQNEFAFEMAVLNYTNPNQNSFFCKMEGFEKDWRHLQKGFVSYTNLDPGTYTFRVKGANNDGVMNPIGDTVQVTIVPPFWKTWPFKISAVILLLLGVTGLTQYRINRIRKEEQNKTEFNRQLAELRMQALRAQMNPHFIFNSLNSILAFMDDGKGEEARRYLAGFSKLVRIILENFSKSTVSLERELESLKLYLEMETLRFAIDFEYTFDIDPELEIDLIQVPPMLIQPYIENALWHGLMHSIRNKRLKIAISEKGNFMEVVVEDNGIGRHSATKLKQQSENQRDSVGMKNTEERLSLQNKQATVQIIDLKDAEGHANGTRVIILISIV